MTSIDQIRRAHGSARPKQSNPAWQNCHHDCGVLLLEIEELLAALKGCKEFFELNMDVLFGIGHDVPCAAGASSTIRQIDAALKKATGHE